MAALVNLRLARKAKAREKARTMADENAVRFGRTKAQKTREAADAARAKGELDAKRLDRYEESLD